jgi:hypothetical protein
MCSATICRDCLIKSILTGSTVGQLADGAVPAGWQVQVKNGGAVTRSLWAYAICAGA